MQKSRFIIVLVVLSLFALSAQFTPPTTVNAQTSLLRVAYMPSWAGTVTTYQVCKLTHATYAFALPNADGSLAALDNTAKLQSLVSTAHGCGVKVTLSVGGYNEGVADFKSISANATYRTNFATNLANLVSTYSLDGVDIDWEYPDTADTTNYTSMLQAIRDRLNTQFGAGTKLLTAAVSAGSYGGAAIASSAFALWDYAMIMAYDGDAGAGHSPYSFAVSALDYWNGRGLAYSKMILGVPFYARPDWYAYNVLRGAGCSADADTCIYPVGGSVTQYYNGRPTLGQKISLIKTRAAKGIMAWDLSQDTQTDSDSLLRYIYCNTGGACGTVPTNTPTKTNTPSVPTNTPAAATATKTNTPSGATATRTNTPVPATATKTPTTGGAIAAWAPNVNYSVGALVTYGGLNYKCLQAHTSQIGWEPPNVPALWQKI